MIIFQSLLIQIVFLKQCHDTSLDGQYGNLDTNIDLLTIVVIKEIIHSGIYLVCIQEMDHVAGLRCFKS